MDSLWYGSSCNWLKGGRTGIGPGGRPAGRPPFTFIAPLGLVRPMTRTHVRLLGPCFKTGRVGHRPFARREREDFRPSAARPSQGCQDTGGFPLRRRERTTLGYQSARAFDVPSNGSRRPTSRGEIRPPARTRTGARPSAPGSHKRIPPSSPKADELNPLGSTFEVPPVWLLTVSRTLELSLQSSFQLSLTVLVRYRSRGHI